MYFCINENLIFSFLNAKFKQYCKYVIKYKVCSHRLLLGEKHNVYTLVLSGIMEFKVNLSNYCNFWN